MINHFRPIPLEADGDMQTDHDAARPEGYRRNQIASDEKDEKDEKAEEEEEAEKDNEEESKKVQTLHSVKCFISSTLPCFMAWSV